MPKLVRVAPEIPANDLEEAVAYYESKLGFEVKSRMPENEYAIVERDGIALHLFGDGGKVLTPLSLHIFTSGIEELYAEFADEGARMSQGVVDQPWGCRDFRVVDPTGNELKFTEPLADD